MTDLQIFNNDEFGQVRVVELEGNPWFVAADVCRVLEIKNVSDSLNRLDADEKMTLDLTEGHSGQRGGAQFINVVNESGLYALVLKSRKPDAKRFRKWLTSEVVPSIRKHGIYMTPETIEKVLLNPDFVIRLATELKNERAKNALLQPKADYYDAILSAEDAVPVTVIAKEYGMSGVTFNKLLNSEQIQFMRDNIWLLYRKYDNRGYTVTQTKLINGRARMFTCWTQKGREFLYCFLKARGILPIRERKEPMASLF